MRPLPLSFYERPCLEVARDLLGKVLVRRVGRTLLAAELVEVEAYLGDEDAASHAYRRRTPRNEIMYGRGGACYVYLSYGMCFCMNVVTGSEGTAQAVLLRAARPIEGLQSMRKNRGLAADAKLTQLCSGPGKLAQAFGVDLRFYGTRFDSPDWMITDEGFETQPVEFTAGPRIGISKAKEFPYRFCVKNSPWLSRKA